jgi:hypothetical protein
MNTREAFEMFNDQHMGRDAAPLRYQSLAKRDAGGSWEAKGKGRGGTAAGTVPGNGFGVNLLNQRINPSTCSMNFSNQLNWR